MVPVHHDKPPPGFAGADRSSDGGPEQSRRLAHELSNLLDGGLRNIGLAISSLRQRAGDGVSADEDALGRLETVDRCLKQMASLLRSWAGGASESDPHREPVTTLGEAMTHLCRLLEPLAALQGVRLEFACDDRAAAHPIGPLAHLIENAVRNSVEAIADQQDDEPARGSRVSVSATVQGEHVVVTIADDGPGFDASMFEENGAFRFGQTTKPAGHGLGLSLCRELLTRAGGTLEVTNAPQGGARITARMPK